MTLNLALISYFLWLIWSGNNAGYGTWSAMLVVTIFNFVVDRAKRHAR